MERPLDHILSLLAHVKKIGNEYMASCPAHDDRHGSLHVWEGIDGRVLMHCHAGCSLLELVAVLGLERQEDNAALVSAPTYTAAERFAVVGLSKGVHPEDDVRLQRYPYDLERLRPVIPGELEAVGLGASGATDVSIYADRDFHGRPSGRRHRMFLRRRSGS